MSVGPHGDGGSGDRGGKRARAIDDQRDKSRDARSGKGQRQSGGDAGSGGGLFDVDRLRL